MITVVALLVGAYAIILLGLLIFQKKLLYHPDTSIPDPARSGVAEMHPIKAENANGLTLVSWYAQGNPGLPVVAYFQGNAGNIGSRGNKVRPFLDAGYGVLLVGYRGFGGNPGTPGEAGLYADARAALNTLKDNRPLVLYGESLGTAVATTMAAERSMAGDPVQALILEAPFPSITAAAGHYYPFIPVKWLLKDHFDQASRIAGISAPVLIFHGERDKTMPVRFGKALFEAAKMPKQSKWIAGAGHNNLFDFGAAELSLEFIRQSISSNP
ncbi:MAG: alpha/beta hydrolase [Rhodospirillaceae bacterium]|nr:alpha/beta hydrolase [Rhodospirillaceae bacterium]MBL6930963.1 alpha/beta hydrolase [Rhodospirillales bacterium]MBL6940724.1 alpha/beta hydrolase [Rhodospirillales bacterium]